jgi:iron-sulfur cluster protein
MRPRHAPRDLAAEIRAALADKSLETALSAAVTGINAKRREVISRFPGYEEARRRARDIEEEAIAALPELIDRFGAAVEASGGHVHHAADGEEACRIINSIARQHDARRVVKSKSMTSEEIRLNEALEAAGLEVRETDLGEYIVQLAGDRPSHIVAPIIHMTLEDVREVFRKSFALDSVPAEPEQLTQLARQRLRADFLAADLGITGANFLLADSGTVVIVENEGNARMSTQLPRAHVVLAGVDKLIPGVADLLPFLQLLPRTATGQLLTSYLSFISGPGWAGAPRSGGEPRGFHVVLLDNGRMAMRDDPLLVEALYCIRCGGCMTVCPPYQVLGGHVYGGPTYHSGIGNAWEAGVSGLATAAGFNDLCTTCSRCQDVCPVSIDIPWMNMVLRERIAESRRRPRGLLERAIVDRLLPTDEPGAVSIAARLFSEPARVYRLARRRPLRALMESRVARLLLERTAGVAADRRLPVPAAETFTSWFRGRSGRVVINGLEAQRASSDRRESTVILFADCHTEHLEIAAGRAAVECLDKCGLGVILVSGHCCGRAALSQGMLRTARRQAEALQRTLAPLAKTGHRIVGIEPSCLSAVADDHRKLLPGGGAEKTAACCHDVLELLDQRFHGAGAGAGHLAARVPEWKPAPTGRRQPLLLHGHCQQKTLGWMPAAVRLLASIPGFELRTTTAECCGMAGSFGYKRDYYPVSAELGRRLIAEIETLEADPRPGRLATGDAGSGWRTKGGGPSIGRGAPEAGARACRYLACGTSCRAQIEELGGRRAVHPVELIAERLR